MVCTGYGGLSAFRLSEGSRNHSTTLLKVYLFLLKIMLWACAMPACIFCGSFEHMCLKCIDEDHTAHGKQQSICYLPIDSVNGRRRP